MDSFFNVPSNVMIDIISVIYRFTKWFYIKFLPFIIVYIGIPLFILGLLLGFTFIGGWILFIIIFIIFMYYFIKGTIFSKEVNKF